MTEKDKLPQKIILFDGVCNLCNGSVNWIIKRDKQKKFHFAAFQSEFGRKFLSERNKSVEKLDSVVLFYPGIAYYEASKAFVLILNELGFPYNLLGHFIGIFPSWFTNIFYRWIANNRYAWFGKKESCMVPTPELKSRFLE